METKTTTVTVQLENVPMDVEGIYTPKEEPIYFDKDGGGYPGAPAEFEAHAIRAGGVNIILLMDESKVEQCEALAIKELE